MHVTTWGGRGKQGGEVQIFFSFLEKSQHHFRLGSNSGTFLGQLVPVWWVGGKPTPPSAPPSIPASGGPSGKKVINHFVTKIFKN